MTALRGRGGCSGCTVAAVQLLTGILVDHFAMVDFAGVVSTSDAVGGVDVCVDDDAGRTYCHSTAAPNRGPPGGSGPCLRTTTNHRSRVPRQTRQTGPRWISFRSDRGL
ncbi:MULTISPECIES: LCP family glycopolymer transferase [Kitasatospora]|uniref:LCP family glycopolymer transferase n=1 Tax=Kitasatospora TaxID=2063 RepID=UPI003CD0BCFB